MKGDELRPDEITAILGVVPSRSHEKGKRWITSSGNEVVERTGIWVLREKDDSGADFSALVRSLISKFDRAKVPFRSLPGVEVAFLDVLVMDAADSDGGGTCEFSLDADCIESLSTLRLPVQFTATVIVE
jgi:hypothetical protein